MSLLTLDKMFLSRGYSSVSAKFVNVDSTMSEQQIQSRINEVSRIPTAATVFQFADGTYNMVGPLVFNGFKEYIVPRGNPTESLTRHTNQAVHLNFSSGAGLLFVNSYVISQWLRVSFDSTASGSYGVKFINCHVGHFHYAYVAGNGATNGSCLRWEKTTGGYSYMTVFANAYYGMHAHECSYIYENNCGTTTPAVNTAVYSEKASQISMVNSGAIVNYTTQRAEANASRIFYVG